MKNQLICLSLMLVSGCGSRQALSSSGSSKGTTLTNQISFSQSPKPSASSSVAASSNSLVFTSLASGTSRIKTSSTRTASSQEEWEMLWKEHSASPSVPTVDFNKQTVLAVFAGQKSTGGYAIKITSIRIEGQKLMVSYHESEPEKGKVTSQVLTAPSHIVKVDKRQSAGDFDSIEFKAE